MSDEFEPWILAPVHPVVPRWPDTCDEDVTRQGESQPCEKVAVAVRYEPNGGEPYAVCAYHARGAMVPLAMLLMAVREEAHRG